MKIMGINFLVPEIYETSGLEDNILHILYLLHSEKYCKDFLGRDKLCLPGNSWKSGG